MADTVAEPEGQMPQQAEPGSTTLHEAEIDALAYRMAEQRANYTAFLQRVYKLTREEAIERAKQDALTDEEREQELAEMPVTQVQWYELDRVAEFAPGAALRKWQKIKREARAELETGFRSCTVMGVDEPWERARYLAVRQGFIEEWQPRGGIELSLIEQMAQSYTGYMTWLEDFHRLQTWEFDRRKVQEEEDLESWNRQKYVTPRMSQLEYEDRALKMAERFQRMFLRSLRALRDLRRYVGHVTINNAGPLSVGGNQQVNVQK